MQNKRYPVTKKKKEKEKREEKKRSYCFSFSLKSSTRSPSIAMPARMFQVSERVLGAVYGALADADVFLEGTLLKPQMIMAGVDAPEKKVCTRGRGTLLNNIFCNNAGTQVSIASW